MLRGKNNALNIKMLFWQTQRTFHIKTCVPLAKIKTILIASTTMRPATSIFAAQTSLSPRELLKSYYPFADIQYMVIYG